MEISGNFQDPAILKPGKRPLYTWGRVLDETPSRSAGLRLGQKTN